MPLEPGDIQEVRISQTAITGEDGRILRTKSISFKVRGQGPFSVQIPAADFSFEKVRPLLEQQAAEIVAIMEIS